VRLSLVLASAENTRVSRPNSGAPTNLHQLFRFRTVASVPNKTSVRHWCCVGTEPKTVLPACLVLRYMKKRIRYPPPTLQNPFSIRNVTPDIADSAKTSRLAFVTTECHCHSFCSVDTRPTLRIVTLGAVDQAFTMGL